MSGFVCLFGMALFYMHGQGNDFALHPHYLIISRAFRGRLLMHDYGLR